MYGGADNLYYICDVTENEDGSITLVLDFDEEHWSYFGAAKNDVYELDGKTIIVTNDGNTWVYTVEESNDDSGNGGTGDIVTPDEEL